MSEKKYFIALDSGTQSIRAVLFDKEGRNIAMEQLQYTPYFSVNPGWAEQDTNEYWSHACRVLKGVIAKSKVDANQVISLAVTSQRNTIIPMDKDGNALRAGIIWLDARTVMDPPPLSKSATVLFTVAGQINAIKYAQKNSKFLWIKKNEPDVYRNTHKFVQVTGFFTRKLTGEFRDSKGMVTGIWPFDYKKLDWYPCDMIYKSVYDAFGIEPKHCVDLYQPNEIIGHVTKEASEATGLPKDLPVVVGGGDKQCELLGAGAIDPSVAVISFGTATAMEVLTKKYITERNMQFFTWPASIPNAWDIEMFIFRGFWMVTWFKQEFGHREAMEAEKRGMAPEQIFDEMISKIPCGSMGLMVQPYWSPLVSDKYAKGSIIGFGDVHSRAHIYRAILEGIGYELRRMNEIVEKKTGVKIKELRVGGGGSKSDVAVQIASDMFNLPASRMETFEISGLGAVIDAAVATGTYSSFDAAVSAMCRKGRTFNPVRENHKIYDQLFNDVYKHTNCAMEPLNKKIGKITGYPPED